MSQILASETLTDAARRAAAQKAINKTIVKYLAIKVGVTLGVCAAVIIVNKIVESKMNNTDSAAE